MSFSSVPLGQLDLRRAKRALLSFKEAEASAQGISVKGPVAGTRPIPLQFNPKEYQVRGQATWSSRSARDGRVGQYQGSQPYTLGLEVFIDEPTRAVNDPTTPPLEDQVDWLLRAVQRVDGDDSLPPVLEFSWGPRTVLAIATSVTAKFTMFDASGKPVRATCQIELKLLPEGWPRQNPTSGTPKIDRSHCVVMGDSLASIAYAKYGDPTLWRAIAKANNIDDPSQIPVGEYLIVPVRSDAESMA